MAQGFSSARRKSGQFSIINCNDASDICCSNLLPFILNVHSCGARKVVPSYCSLICDLTIINLIYLMSSMIL